RICGGSSPILDRSHRRCLVNSRRFALAALLLTLSAATATAQFTSGNIVVERVGDGQAALTNAATAVFLDSFSSADGSAVSSLGLLSTGAANSQNLLTASGTATSEGQITRSTNGLYITLGGYSAPAGTAAIASTTSAAANRSVLLVDPTGAFSN